MTDALHDTDSRLHPGELPVHRRHRGARPRRLAARPRHRRFDRHARDHLLHRRAARREGEGRGNDSGQPRLGEQDRDLRRVEAPGRLNTRCTLSIWSTRSLEVRSARMPDATALVVATARVDLRATSARAPCRHARCLQRAACEQGARVALLLRNSPQYVARCTTACWPPAASPCRSMRRSAPSVLARQIEHCGASRADRRSGASRMARRCAAARAATPCRRQSRSLDDGDEARDAFARARTHGRAAPAAAHVASRGDLGDASSIPPARPGRPKGVMLSHGNLAANAHAIIAYLGLTADDRGSVRAAVSFLLRQLGAAQPSAARRAAAPRRQLRVSAA